MKTVTVAMAVLVIISAGSAVAQESPRNAVVNAQRVGPSRPSKTVSKVHQPVGTPHKASSFAPHPTKKRVFGDPIQPPIVHNVPPAPPTKTAPK
ncbi:MAG: hypothetical protein QOI59_6617 [Gammaproteobacteria bacterium]|nr:hypothetical protein [Gammaproteobacteria bacterium]